MFPGARGTDDDPSRSAAPSPNVSQFVRDHCAQIPSDFRRKGETTSFDRAWLDFVVNRAVHPVDRFAAALSQMCQVRRGRWETELVVAEHCGTPAMLAVLDKTVGALRVFEPIRQQWTAWAETKLASTQESPPKAFVAKSGDLDRRGGRGGRGPEEEDEEAERGHARGNGGSGGRDPEDQERARGWWDKAIALSQSVGFKPPLRVPGWKKLLVAMLIQSPESRVLWPRYKDEFLRQACGGGLSMTFRRGRQPRLLASEEWLTEHFSDVELEVLKGLMGRYRRATAARRASANSTAETTAAPGAGANASAEEAAGNQIQAGEDIAETTLAATHLTDVCEHSEVAHTIIDDALLPQEAKQALHTARTIATRDYKPIHILGGVQVLASELALHGVGSLGALRDIVSLATNSDSIVAAVSTLRAYLRARASAAQLGVFLDLVDEADLVGLVNEDVAEQLGATGSDLISALVRGSDALVKLVSVMQKLPSEICEAFQVNVHDMAQQTDQFLALFDKLHS